MDLSAQTVRRRAEDEARFCDAWSQARSAILLRFTYIVTAIAHSFSLILLPLFVDPTVVRPLMAVHATAVLMLGGGIALKSNRARRMAMMLIMTIVLLGYLALLYYVCSVMRTPRDILLASIGVVAYSAAGIQLFPARGVTLYLFGAVLAALAFPAAWEAPGGPIWATVFAIMTAYCLALRAVMDLRLDREARSEFRFRSQVAPAHIVRHAAGDTTDLTEAFRPETKLCVCVSSDWRNYQELSANLSPSQLSMTLNEYYDLCQALLAQHLPHGNYFTDWIADELFVVIFPVGGATDEGLVDAALAFSLALLNAKNDFLRVHGLPRAVDVGVAAGQALIGLMGPEGLKKATALGEVPGRSRRMQGAGKLLRRKCGDGDRVVFGRECLMRMTKPLKTETVALADNEAVRDLKDREIFYLDRDAADAEPAPLARLA